MSSLLFLALLGMLALCNCELSVIPRESSIVLPSTTDDGQVSIAAFLYCMIEANVTDFITTWTTPNGNNITVDGFQNATGTPSDRLVAINAGVRSPVGSTNETANSETVFIINRLSYMDAGNYTCTVEVTGGEESGSVGSATLELTLLLNVTAVESERSARLGQAATLSCEMSLYIRNDSDFQWRSDDLVLTDNENHSITYTDSMEFNAQKGRLVRTRVSTLTIFSMESSDEGNYTCFVSGTEQSATVQLMVDLSPEETTVVPSTPSRGSISPKPTEDGSVSTDDGSFIVPLVVSLSVITVIISFIVTLMVTLAITNLLLKSRRKQQFITNNTQFKTTSQVVVNPQESKDRTVPQSVASDITSSVEEVILDEAAIMALSPT